LQLGNAEMLFRRACAELVRGRDKTVFRRKSAQNIADGLFGIGIRQHARKADSPAAFVIRPEYLRNGHILTIRIGGKFRRQKGPKGVGCHRRFCHDDKLSWPGS
jgi:hypothetical protein